MSSDGFQAQNVLTLMATAIEQWDCPNCGAHHDREVNAVKNILAAGQAVSVCGEIVKT